MPNKYFIEKIKEQDFTIADVFTEVAKDFPTLNVTKVKRVLVRLLKVIVRVSAITYNTLDPDGNPVISSGIIMRPINRKSRGVLHFLPSANIDKFGSGSDALLIFEGVLSFFGYTVIIADLLGNGVTKDTIEYPFLINDNIGQVAYDMHRAAIEFFPQELGFPLQHHISIGGYSLGASCALALLRHIERVNPPDIIVDRTLVGGGLYDINLAFDGLIKTGFAQYPAAPGIYYAYDKWYRLHLDYSKLFIDPLLSHMHEWLDRTHDRFQLIEWISQNLHAYLHPDAFTPETNEEFRKAVPYFALNSLKDGWTPKSLVVLSHASDDQTVPVEVTTETYKAFKSRGAKVRVRYGKGGHYTFGMHYFVRMGVYLILKRFALWTRK